jgi:anti-sigma factor RsiW
MSHQPYENLLLSTDTLDEVQQKQLDLHLQDCPHCASLAAALAGLDKALTHSPSPAPLPGFTQRWHVRLSDIRQKRQKRNLWLMTLGLFALAVLIASTILVGNLIQVNWAYLLSQWVARVSLFAAQARQVSRFIRSLTQALPITIPILVLFGTGSLLVMAALVTIWISTIVQLYFPSYERENQP